MSRRLHPAKATCPHGFPWYETCSQCGDVPPPDRRVKLVVEFGVGQFHIWWYSDFQEFFKAHPEAAEALTK
jgi:hypothetical protein